MAEATTPWPRLPSVNNFTQARRSRKQYVTKLNVNATSALLTVQLFSDSGARGFAQLRQERWLDDGVCPELAHLRLARGARGIRRRVLIRKLHLTPDCEEQPKAADDAVTGHGS